jgi:hypothetical protein
MFTPSVAGADTITAAYSGDAIYAASSGTASLTVLAPPSSSAPLASFAPPSAKPSNSFALSRPKLNKRRGTATLTATVPGPGKLLLEGKGIKKLGKYVRRAGKVTLTVKTDPRTKRTLERTGKATVTAKVTYTPTGGDPKTTSTRFTLRRDRL